MSLDIWTEPSGYSFGTYNERNKVSIPLPISSPIHDLIRFKLISGKLPRGLRLEGSRIVGTPFEVPRVTTYTFVIRAEYMMDISDRTFTMTISGEDEPQWLTPEGLLPIGANQAFYIIDSSFIDFNLSSIDTDTAAGQKLTYFIASGEGELPPGLVLQPNGRITGFIQPLLQTPKYGDNGNYDVGFYDTVAYDFGVRPANGYDSFVFDNFSYDYFIATLYPRKLNRNYEFIATVTDGDTVTKRRFRIYVVGDDFFRADNVIMEAGEGTYTADVTYVRAPVFTTPKYLGLRRADNYQTFKIDIFEGFYNELGTVFYELAAANAIINAVTEKELRTDNAEGSTFIRFVKANGIPQVGYKINFNQDFVGSNNTTYTVTAVEVLGGDFYRVEVDQPLTGNIPNSVSIYLGTESRLPPGMQFDITTGEVFGVVPYQPAVTETYNFTVKARRIGEFTQDEQGGTRFEADTSRRMFTVDILGEVESSIKWNSNSNLGTIDVGFPSSLLVNAETTYKNSTIFYTLEDGQLPPGLNLNLQGEIVGKVNQLRNQNTYKSYWKNNRSYQKKDIVKTDVVADIKYLIRRKNIATAVTEENHNFKTNNIVKILTSDLSFNYNSGIKVFNDKTKLNAVTGMEGQGPYRVRFLIGNSLTKNYVSRGSNVTLHDVVWNNQYVAIGENGKIRKSTDGVTWIDQTDIISKDLYGITYANGQYVVVGQDGTILTSPTSNSWIERTSGTIVQLNSVTYGLGKFIAVGNNGVVLSSTDGITWVTVNSSVTRNLRKVIWNGNLFVAIGDNGILIRSANGIVWTNTFTGSFNNFKDITWDGEKFLVVGSNGALITSTTGTSWKIQNIGVTYTLNSIVSFNGQYVIVGAVGKIITSVDGAVWTEQSSNTTQILYSIKWNGSQFVVVGQKGEILTSSDSNTWNTRNFSADTSIVLDNTDGLSIGMVIEGTGFTRRQRIKQIIDDGVTVILSSKPDTGSTLGGQLFFTEPQDFEPLAPRYTKIKGTSAVLGEFETATPVSAKSTSGNGTGAEFLIKKSNGVVSISPVINNFNYSSLVLDNEIRKDIVVVNTGTGYLPGDTITISGADLGGADDVNDLTFTLLTAFDFRFKVNGNSTTTYNGEFVAVNSTTTSITLLYESNPGTFGVGLISQVTGPGTFEAQTQLTPLNYFNYEDTGPTRQLFSASGNLIGEPAFYRAKIDTVPAGSLTSNNSYWEVYNFPEGEKTPTTIDKNNTYLDFDGTTIDRTYTFTVKAKDILGYSAIEDKFTLAINIPNSAFYSNITAKPFLKQEQRAFLKDFVNDSSIFDPNLIYRLGDNNFGVQRNLSTLVYAGIETRQAVEYISAMGYNNKPKRFMLGNVKKAVAKTPGTNNVEYEVVYLELIDPLEKNGKFLPYRISTSPKLQNVTVDNTNEFYDGLFDVDNPFWKRPDPFNATIDRGDIIAGDPGTGVKFPSSISIWRKRLREIETARRERNYLPLWMRSIQSGSYVELDFVPAVVLCYCKPGKADEMLLNIKNSGFDFKLLDYTIDRYIIDAVDGYYEDKYLVFRNDRTTIA